MPTRTYKPGGNTRSYRPDNARAKILMIPARVMGRLGIDPVVDQGTSQLLKRAHQHMVDIAQEVADYVAPETVGG